MPLLNAHIVPHPPLAVPEVGRGMEKNISQTLAGYRRVAKRVAADRPDVIIFISPHGQVYADYIHIAPGPGAKDSLARFGAPEVECAPVYDESFIAALSARAEALSLPAGTRGAHDRHAVDHGVSVPMYFINAAYTAYQTVRISIAGLPYDTHYRMGQCIRETIEATGRRAVIIASGDLSHKLTADGPYGFAPEGPAFDEQLCDALRQGDFLRLLSFDYAFCDKAAECGLRSFIMMAGALDGHDVEVWFHGYEGPFGVGYAVCSFTPGAKNPARHFLPLYEEARARQMEARRAKEDAYVRLARLTLETYVKTGHILPHPPDIPQDLLTRRAATFVSIKKEGRLRGCIGTTEPSRSHIADEIIGNAIAAGTQDPRFDAVTADELPYLHYSVDVLSPAEPVANADALDATRYGVIVSSGRKRGLLLPNLDGVDTVAEQIAIALQKAGIAPDEPYTLSRFEVVRHL